MAQRRIPGVNAFTTTLSGAAASRPTFAAAVETSLEPVYRYLVFLTGDAALAEDLAADTFERGLRSWHRYDPRRGAATTWLCQIARTVALDHFRAGERRRRREAGYAAREPRDEQAPSLGDGFSGELEHALAGLSAADREVLALRVVLELDATAAARLLGISSTACTTRLNRALKRLEERLESNAHV